MPQDPDDLQLADAPSRPLGLRVLAGVGALAFALIAVNLAVVIVRMLLEPTPEPKPRSLPPVADGSLPGPFQPPGSTQRQSLLSDHTADPAGQGRSLQAAAQQEGLQAAAGKDPQALESASAGVGDAGGCQGKIG